MFLRSKKICYYSCLFLLGIAFMTFFEEGSFLPAGGLMMLAGILAVRVSRWGAVLFFMCGVLRCLFAFMANDAILTDASDEERVSMTIRGLVVADVVRNFEHQKLFVRLVRPSSRQDGVKIFIKAPLYPEVRYGDDIEGECILQPVAHATMWDYGGYLQRRGVFLTCERMHRLKILQTHRNGILSFLYSLKDIMERRLSSLYREPYASLMAGILLGEQGMIDEEVLRNFRGLGLTHILVISGAHIAIFILLGHKLLFFLNQKARFVMVAVFCVIFLSMIAFPSSAVRGALMSLGILLALLARRLKKNFLLISLTASLLCLWDPFMLVYDRGFQLSFLAVIGILYLKPYISHLFGTYEESPVVDIFSLSAGAYISTIILVSLSFGFVSPLAILANMIIVPMIVLIMDLGMLSMLVSYIAPMNTIFMTWILALTETIAGVNRSLSWDVWAAGVNGVALLIFFLAMRWYYRREHLKFDYKKPRERYEISCVFPPDVKIL